MEPETARKSKQPRVQFIPALLLALLLPVAPLAAQEGEQSAAEEPTKRTAAMGEKVYRKLAEAQAFTDVEPPNFAAAMRTLDELKASPKLSPYETAQLYNFYGFVYYAQERYKDSIRAYETVLKQPELPEALRTQTIYTLAQLHFTTEEWQKAIDLINQWLRTANKPSPDSYILLASAYYQLNSYQEMIAPVEKAMSIAEDRGTPAKEQWWLLLRVAYYELENYKKVKDILEVLVSNWPKKEYWTQLAAMYGELEDEKRQLSAYESAYDQGFLVRSNELVQLAQLFLQAEVPYKAAQVMEKGFEQDQIEKTAQNYRSLSQAWQMAGDDKKAIVPLKSAAALSNDGILDVRLANSYLNLSRYDECTTAARAGINKGDLRRPDTAYEILGMCLFELDQYEDAKKAFRQAAKDDRTKKRARNWIAFIEKEQERLQQLEDSLKLVRRNDES
jgi:tetratricopeptide (TPR) repeat protein